MGYLDFWVTRTGTQPINKKVESIVNMTPPKNTKEVRVLIGIINYYWDMWARRSYLLHPFTVLTSNKAKFKWIDVEQKVFDYIKLDVAQDILLSYPDFNECFDIHMDAIYYQLGELIIHEVKTIAFYSRKPTGPQTQYTVMEK